MAELAGGRGGRAATASAAVRAGATPKVTLARRAPAASARRAAAPAPPKRSAARAHADPVAGPPPRRLTKSQAAARPRMAKNIPPRLRVAALGTTSYARPLASSRAHVGPHGAPRREPPGRPRAPLRARSGSRRANDGDRRRSRGQALRSRQDARRRGRACRAVSPPRKVAALHVAAAGCATSSLASALRRLRAGAAAATARRTCALRRRRLASARATDDGLPARRGWRSSLIAALPAAAGA